MNLLEAIIAGKIGGGTGGEVTPDSVVNATANMTSEQKTDTKDNLGVVECTAENVVLATADMTTEQSAQTRQNIGAQASEITTTVSGATPTIDAADNTIYECGELTLLTISSFPADGKFWIWFTSGATPTTTIGISNFAAKANKIYKITVEKGYATYDCWPIVSGGGE